MSYTITPPHWPTHAVNHIDNHDGEGDRCFSFAFMVDGDYYHWEGGSPILEYQGDIIISVWKLNDKTELLKQKEL